MHGCLFLYQLWKKNGGGGVLILKIRLMPHFFLQMSITPLDFPSVPLITESFYYPIWKVHEKCEMERNPQCEFTIVVVKNGLPLWLLKNPLGKNSPTLRETWVQSLGRDDALEKGKAAGSSILAWRIPWTI